MVTANGEIRWPQFKNKLSLLILLIITLTTLAPTAQAARCSVEVTDGSINTDDQYRFRMTIDSLARDTRGILIKIPRELAITLDAVSIILGERNFLTSRPSFQVDRVSDADNEILLVKDNNPYERYFDFTVSRINNGMVGGNKRHEGIQCITCINYDEILNNQCTT